MQLPHKVHETIIRSLLLSNDGERLIRAVKSLQQVSRYWRDVVDRMIWKSFHSIGTPGCDCWACGADGAHDENVDGCDTLCMKEHFHSLPIVPFSAAQHQPSLITTS